MSSSTGRMGQDWLDGLDPGQRDQVLDHQVGQPLGLLAHLAREPAHRLGRVVGRVLDRPRPGQGPGRLIGVLSSWLVLATKSRFTSSTRRLSVWSSARTRTSPPPPTAAPRGATRTAKLVVPSAQPGHRDLELALPDLAVPSHLAGQGGQFGDHEPVPLDQPEGPGRGAGPQHAVIAVHHDGRGGEDRQDGGNAREQPGGLMGGPQPGVTRGPDGAAPGGSYRHAISAVRASGAAPTENVNGEDSHTQWYAVAPRAIQRDRGSPGDIRRLFILRTASGKAVVTGT